MEIKNTIAGQSFDEERALYNLKNTKVEDCVFAGPKDGESVLKETKAIQVSGCSFSLRYPLWHADGFVLTDSTFDEKTRAPLWYDKKGEIANLTCRGTKCLRECSDISIFKSDIQSDEFGWKCQNIKVIDSSLESQYLFLDSKNIEIDKLKMKGKYSFQYITDMTISDSNLDTKDAFWHTKNVTVRNSIIKGEYLAWFSNSLTLINCTIISHQPFCYCKNLKLVNCTMEGSDLAFEYSDVQADIKGGLESIKNPKSGVITVDYVKQIITDEPVVKCTGKVVIRESK
jgi:hypothetical protein